MMAVPGLPRLAGILLAAPEQVLSGVRIKLRCADDVNPVVAHVRVKPMEFRPHQFAPDQEVIEATRDPPF